MSYKRIHTLPAALAALMVLTALPGCFTGIEGTAVIKDKSKDRTSLRLSAEKQLVADVKPDAPSAWLPGKELIFTDGNASLAFTPSSEAGRLVHGDTLRFAGFTGMARLAGDSVTDFRFRTPRGSEITHRIEAPVSAVMQGGQIPVPFTVEVSMVRKANALLSGRTLWNLRPDSRGRRYQKVTVREVTAGTSTYPLTVVLLGGDSVQMVAEGRGLTSRTFDRLFSLTNPRDAHRDVSDEHWELICSGKVAEGMTLEECRLALGAPAAVERMAAANALIEHWTYENGIYLYFTDGILTRFRQ